MCCCDEKKKGCLKPENLAVRPGECTPEQVRECHGDEPGHPCVENARPACRKPENLAGRPGECTPEQVRECHGDEPGHPCAG